VSYESDQKSIFINSIQKSESRLQQENDNLRKQLETTEQTINNLCFALRKIILEPGVQGQYTQDTIVNMVNIATEALAQAKEGTK
jgi:hypothetical protein